jgi:hypothetical protein
MGESRWDVCNRVSSVIRDIKDDAVVRGIKHHIIVRYSPSSPSSRFTKLFLVGECL